MAFPPRLGTAAADVGIKVPRMTGMIRYGDIGTVDFSLVSGFGDLLNYLKTPPSGSFVIDPSQLAGATATDWVAFTLTAGRVGRRHDQILTGPDGNSPYLGAIGSIAYRMSDIPGGQSPTAQIALPEYSPPDAGPQRLNGVRRWSR
jgi:hypothetical protein